MLLPRKASEIEPLFQFYRVGWGLAKQGKFLPKSIEDPQMDYVTNMYFAYDLQAGYWAYINRMQRTDQ
jgi:hypothetical protein